MLYFSIYTRKASLLQNCAKKRNKKVHQLILSVFHWAQAATGLNRNAPDMVQFALFLMLRSADRYRRHRLGLNEDNRLEFNVSQMKRYLKSLSWLPAHRATLARCIPKRVAYKHSVMMFSTQHGQATLSDRFLPTGIRRLITARSSICQPTAPDCTVLRATCIYPTGFFCHWRS